MANDALALEGAQDSQASRKQQEKVLPLPGWLVKVYFIFPVVLYIPDALFNYYVYSDGAFGSRDPNLLIQVGAIALWGFLAIGVVGMAYLLSVLAPWHWGQGHPIQAIFCGLGVLVATAITTWNSLAYRSQNFSAFPTDQWIYGIWPQLQQMHFSLTMILVAIAPPFWGLFWALVQPTQTGRSLRQLQESHAERLLRVQHEAEVKRLKAETGAKVREAQLRGMAATAAAARTQASGLLKRTTENPGEATEADRATEEHTLPTNMAPASPTPIPTPIPAPAVVRIATSGATHVATNQATASDPTATPPARTARSRASTHTGRTTPTPVPTPQHPTPPPAASGAPILRPGFGQRGPVSQPDTASQVLQGFGSVGGNRNRSL